MVHYHLEPIDCAAVDESGELADARAQRGAGGRHGQHDVQLVAHDRHEVRVQCGRAAVRLQRLVPLPVDLRDTKLDQLDTLRCFEAANRNNYIIIMYIKNTYDSHFLTYFCLLIGPENIRHFSRIQHVVNVFQKAFFFYLYT